MTPFVAKPEINFPSGKIPAVMALVETGPVTFGKELRSLEIIELSSILLQELARELSIIKMIIS